MDILHSHVVSVNCIPLHQYSLTFIFNQSLSTDEVPDDWCIANIFALHKKGAKELPENYRPISLMAISSKILEHIVYSSISRFLADNNILTQVSTVFDLDIRVRRNSF